METLRSYLGRDLAALGLLGLVIFLGAALWSHDPADPPAQQVFPQRASLANWCGRAGAWVSWGLVETVGIGAYYLVLSLACLDAALLARRNISDPVFRFGGWLASLAGLTTLAAMVWPAWPSGPVIGPGGYLGATLHALLGMHFGRVGTGIVALSLLVGGLLLATETFMLLVLRWGVVAPAKGLWQGAVRVAAAYMDRLTGRPTGSRAAKTSQTKPETDQTSLRIKRPASVPEARVFSSESSAESQADAASANPPVGSAASEPPGSEPRIRKPQKPSREEWLQEIESASRA
ncbi:MAG TPA: DNA translocase FtsK 4TM domain-containing protein, partial [Thermoguttaceae bacterium]|nr:DNA translocase FtsK 4TM domain-containing protein [Thermoguttaceae bacterium]